MASKLEAVATGDLNDYANWAPCSLEDKYY